MSTKEIVVPGLPVAIMGRRVKGGVPTDGQILQYIESSGLWEAVAGPTAPALVFIEQINQSVSQNDFTATFANSFDFSTYKYCVVEVLLDMIDNGANGTLYSRINGISSNTYFYQSTSNQNGAVQAVAASGAAGVAEGRAPANWLPGVGAGQHTYLQITAKYWKDLNGGLINCQLFANFVVGNRTVMGQLQEWFFNNGQTTLTGVGFRNSVAAQTIETNSYVRVYGMK